MKVSSAGGTVVACAEAGPAGDAPSPSSVKRTVAAKKTENYEPSGSMRFVYIGSALLLGLLVLKRAFGAV